MSSSVTPSTPPGAAGDEEVRVANWSEKEVDHPEMVAVLNPTIKATTCGHFQHSVVSGVAAVVGLGEYLLWRCSASQFYL